MRSSPNYSKEPVDSKRYTAEFNRFYTGFARTYDRMIKALPVWRNWLRQVLPYLNGPQILEVSFGTGYLLTQYAERFTVYGVDYNLAMIEIARENLERHNITAALQQADVEHLPYATASVDTVVNTLGMSSYPNGEQALVEMMRVLKPGGNLVLLDFNFPSDRNWLGTSLTRFWRYRGNIVVREMSSLFRAVGLTYRELEVGGAGSVHLYLAEKR
jgi:ubiquinone/menaquinone biosynthesis C-methylase UbiE